MVDGDAVDDEEEGEAAPASGLRRRDPVREGPAGWLQRWLGSSRGRGDVGVGCPDRIHTGRRFEEAGQR